jgi:hypothetical protein
VDVYVVVPNTERITWLAGEVESLVETSTVGLYEFLWRVRSDHPKDSDEELRQTAEATLARLLAAEAVSLVRLVWPSDAMSPVPSDYQIQSSDWAPPGADGSSYLAVVQGRRAKDSKSDPVDAEQVDERGYVVFTKQADSEAPVGHRGLAGIPPTLIKTWRDEGKQFVLVVIDEDGSDAALESLVQLGQGLATTRPRPWITRGVRATRMIHRR